VSGCRADLLRELEVLRQRVAALVDRAAAIDPANVGLVAAYLHNDLPLTLGASKENDRG
jgi:hypothetical protein